MPALISPPPHTANQHDPSTRLFWACTREGGGTLDQLVASVQKDMEGLAASMGCRPHAEPEDVVQNAWSRALRSARTFDPARGSFGAWFARIVINETIELRRQAARRHQRRLIPEAEGVDHERPDRDLDRDEACTRLKQALAELPATWAEALRLRYVTGCTSGEAGRQLGVPAATIRTWTARGLGALRERLDESCLV